MYTVTVTAPADMTFPFEDSTRAHIHARALKKRFPYRKVAVTDDDGNTVEFRVQAIKAGKQ